MGLQCLYNINTIDHVPAWALCVSVGGCCIQIHRVVLFQVKAVFSLFPMQGGWLLAAILMLCQGFSLELVFS